MSGVEIRGLRRRFGGVTAVDDVDLDVPAGAVTALIGPNGAGKTTLFHCVTGLDTADAGTVTLVGGNTDRLLLSGLPPHARARAGVAWTFQRIELFAGLTVAENIRVGAENRRGRPLLSGLLGLPDPRRGAVRATTAAVLDRLGLTALADVPAGLLPTGTMRLVELGRALAAEPVALLLDEPASGLDDDQIARLAEVVRALAADGLAILLVEHDMRFVTVVADRAYLMVAGRVLLSGGPDEVFASEVARDIYIGES
ncbi:ABC transporter related [Catenulispora acidiphila DSM 44928]|uniref:ABC transporter related n=1 Tax=Catenulispora acidiphila (strain DSM 44928 / JCM 14897 / NBRC 102108 / NRRL B-24433 / ID139908) TaxID=479433 RepID=C7Q2A8_CATAD|nr:ABC transporter ATP-binding protein [Catenulispora acidiphila]ACU77645.1 ABC transporter related [Catenulispora acidiphila DSM 44928]